MFGYFPKIKGSGGSNTESQFFKVFKELVFIFSRRGIQKCRQLDTKSGDIWK